MANPETRTSGESRALEKTPGQILVEKVLQGLGSEYFAESIVRIEIVDYNPNQQFAYKEIQIKRRGRLASKRAFLGARAFFTLFADGGFVREVELKSKEKDRSPVQNIEGYTMGDGDFKLLVGGPQKKDIPEAITKELDEAGAVYFATSERYLYQKDTSGDLDKIANAFGRSI